MKDIVIHKMIEKYSSLLSMSKEEMLLTLIKSFGQEECPACRVYNDFESYCHGCPAKVGRNLCYTQDWYGEVSDNIHAKYRTHHFDDELRTLIEERLHFWQKRKEENSEQEESSTSSTLE